MPHTYDRPKSTRSEPGQPSLVLALDQGGQSTRARIYDLKGTLIAASQSPLQADHPQENIIEYPDDSVLSSLTNVIQAVCHDENVRLQDIKCAGLATQRSNIALWSYSQKSYPQGNTPHGDISQTGMTKDDLTKSNLLAPIISWQDTRGEKWMQQFRQQQSRIHVITGLFPSAHYGVSKLQWCIEHIPEVARAKSQHHLRCGPMSSYLLHALLDGSPFLTDPINASRTLLYDSKQLNWSPELAQLFSFDTTLLPQCVSNQYTFGNLSIDGHAIPLRIVTGDQSAALFAHGIPDTDNAYITLGTGAFVTRPTGNTQHSHEQLLSSLIHSDEKQTSYSLEGTINGAASVIEYYAHIWDIKDLKKLLPTWLANIDRPPLFMNHYAGLGTPFLNTTLNKKLANSFIVKNSHSDDIPYKMVAIVESIVFLITLNLNLIKQQSGTVKQLLIGGGLAQLDGICQRIADLNQCPVIRHQETETTSQGLAWLLSNTVKKNLAPWSQETSISTFKPQANPLLAERYQHWSTIMDRSYHVDI